MGHKKRWKGLVGAFVVFLVLLALLYWIGTLLPTWVYKPLGLCTGTPSQIDACKGYNFHSGIGANFGYLALLAGLLAHGWSKQCHITHCYRWGRFKVRNTPYVVCKKHFEEIHCEAPEAVTPEHVRALYLTNTQVASGMGSDIAAFPKT